MKKNKIHMLRYGIPYTLCGLKTEELRLTVTNGWYSSLNGKKIVNCKKCLTKKYKRD